MQRMSSLAVLAQGTEKLCATAAEPLSVPRNGVGLLPAKR
jgi:hypothetical protein